MLIQNYEFVSGVEFRCLRILKNLKQETVAKRLGITRQAYSKIECNKKITISKANKVLAALGCTFTDLENIKSFIAPSSTESEKHEY